VARPRRPLVIAHRGASGYLPEHTLAAKALAAGQGADYLEQDVVAAADGTPVVLHDLWLERVSDVASRHPGRARADGHWYVRDFGLGELRALRLNERRAADGRTLAFPGRYDAGGAVFPIVTLDEEIAFARELSRTLGRTLGLYAEIKHPAWHRDHGVELARAVHASFVEAGLGRREDPVFLQCFDGAELERLRGLGCELRLVALLERGTAWLGDGEALKPELARIAGYADAIGPPLEALVEVDEDGAWRPSPLVAAAREAGLELHPWTFRRDRLPPFASSFERLVRWFAGTACVDALFTDHPDAALRALAGG
jgi:glycerophosphoryl diester phosphodiesterase